MTIVQMTRGSVTIELGERQATVQGEFYPSATPVPLFEAYSKMLVNWDDGTVMSDADRRAVLDDLIAAAGPQRWDVAVI